MTPSKGPPPLAEPEISGCPLPLRSFRQPWIRIHKRHRDPLHFGKTGEQRFDDPSRGFGVLYASLDIHGAFVETFIRNQNDRHISLAEIELRIVSEIVFPDPLRLVNLSEEGLRRLGADLRLTTGDYTMSQKWALAFYRHPDRPDGIFYCSRLNASLRCVAIFERTRATASCTGLGSLADPKHGHLLSQLLDLYDVSLL